MDFWVPLLSALAGALIGSITTIATVFIQAGKDEKKHMRDAAVQLALADHREAIEHAKAVSTPLMRQSVAPIAHFFAYHLKALSLAAKGELVATDFEALKELRESLKQLG